jgi:hypothetical protein
MQPSKPNAGLLTDPTPERLRKFAQRIASLAPGMAYTITLIIEDAQAEPFWMVTSLGKIEGLQKKINNP